ncbi:MAG TPA: hypothetical protein PLI09_21270 [Candidatus Hydrogenedentes bacterium]|nr:hypothetical protein [Candidatus Hydrogenedentota bacterium]
MEPVNDVLQRLLKAKEDRRKELARLPIEEKVKIVVRMQHMAAPLLRQRGKEVHPWTLDEK